MTPPRKSAAEALHRLADLLLEDDLAMSDEEIRAEFADDHGDPETAAAELRVRGAIQRALREHGDPDL